MGLHHREPIGVVVGHFGLQPSAQLDCPPGRAGHGGGMPGDREAGTSDAAIAASISSPGTRSGPARGLVPDCILENNELAEKLATDPRVAFLTFIGSSRVGWHLRTKLPPGTRCALEHGGAAPASSTGAPTSMLSSSPWSRAATTTPARSASRPSASTFTPISNAPSSTASLLASPLSGLGTRSWQKRRSALSFIPARPTGSQGGSKRPRRAGPASLGAAA